MVIAELFARLGLQVDSSAWAKGNDAVAKLSESVRHLGEAFLVFEGFKKLGEWINASTEAAVGAEHLAQKVGASVESVQRLGYAADVTGASTEEMQVGLVHLARGLDEAKKGTGPAAEAFQKLGIRMTDPAVKSGDLSQVFLELSDRMSDLPDGATKTALTMDLLGRSGAALIPTMNQGKDGLRELGEEAESLGAVMSKETVEKLVAFEKGMKRVHAISDGLRNTLAEGLAPAVTELAGDFTKWFKAHREEIITKVTKAALWLGHALEWLGDKIGVVTGILDEIGTALEALFPDIDIFKTVMVAAGIAMAIAWIAALGPIGLIAVLIGALVLVGQDLYSSIVNNDGAFADLWAELKKHLSEGTINAIVAGFHAWWETTKLLFAVFESEGERAYAIISKIVDAIKWLVDHAGVIRDLAAPLAALLPSTSDVVSSIVGKDAPAAPIDHWDSSEGLLDRIHDVAVTSTSLAQTANPMLPPTNISAPFNLTLHLDTLTGDATEIASRVRDIVDVRLDEHVRNIAGVIQGGKR